MNNERLQILKMVQEGKVSPEEAAKLLEAVEQPDAKRPKPKAVRLMISEGGKTSQLVLNIGMVQWLFRLPGTVLTIGKYDKDGVLAAITQGAPGKVLEAEEGNKRFELWLD